jgi:hypothetical protein
MHSGTGTGQITKVTASDVSISNVQFKLFEARPATVHAGLRGRHLFSL